LLRASGRGLQRPATNDQGHSEKSENLAFIDDQCEGMTFCEDLPQMTKVLPSPRPARGLRARRAHALHKRAAKLPTPVVYFVCTEVDKGVGEQVCYILDHGIYQRVRLG
jgi:hypothetical protein